MDTSHPAARRRDSAPALIPAKPLDYSAPAELFFSGGVGKRMDYRRFATAAEAIAFVMERAGAPLRFVTLEVDEERFDSVSIARLYEHPDYPRADNPATA
jgi:hypothetical protein